MAAYSRTRLHKCRKTFFRRSLDPDRPLVFLYRSLCLPPSITWSSSINRLVFFHRPPSLFLSINCENIAYIALTANMMRVSSIEVGIAILLLYILKRLFFDKRTALAPLPPGPKGLPVLGNVKDLPPSGTPEFEHWLKHKDQYGPISSVTALGLTMVIMHDKSMVMELMEKRGSKHSGRARMKFAMDMFVP